MTDATSVYAFGGLVRLGALPESGGSANVTLYADEARLLALKLIRAADQAESEA